MCKVGIQSKRDSHISFLYGGDPLCVLERRPENIYDMFDWVTLWSLPSLERLTDLSPSAERPADISLSFERPVGGSLRLRDQQTSPLRLINHWIFAFNPKLLTLYSFSKSHAEVWISSSPHVFTGHRNLHTSSLFSCDFFNLICERKYMSFYP